MNTSYFFIPDNGLVISISIIQWTFEVINVFVYLLYIYFIYGYSNFLDKFFTLYLIFFMTVLQPSFYLNGDAAFRRLVANEGLIRAVKWALFS